MTMGNKQTVIVVIYVLCVLQLYAELLIQHQTNINFKNITHVLPYQDQILLVDNERIYILNTALDIQSNVTTCADNVRDCVNVMKIFLLDQQKVKLITCGSGNSGKCQIRNVSKIVQVTDESQYNVVSTESNKPATAILTPDNNILVGATYGDGYADVNTATELRYSYPLSTRLTEYNRYVEINVQLQLQIKKDSGLTLTDYLIYFKKVQRSENFTYLITNQKKYVGSNEGYVSKLIRLCDTDTTKATTIRATFDTYVDMEIVCEKDGKTYNLIQDVSILEYKSDHYFLGVFANSADPENIAGSGAVCATKVSQIYQNIRTIGKRYTSCSTSYTENQRYFPNSWDICNAEETVSCDPLRNFKYILGDTPLTLTPLYVHDVPDEYLTKIKGRKVEVQNNEEKLAINVGSSKGKLMQFNFMGMDHSLEKYDEESVHPGFPIIDFYETEESDAMFVASQRKFVKYTETTCSEFSTCKETIEGRNPLCGWCVYDGKSTRKKQCSSQTHWLSALGQCVQLSLDPQGQLVSDADRTVQISVEGLQGGVTDTNTYKCTYINSLGEAIIEVEANITGQKLACSTPNEQSSSVFLHLMVNRGGVEVLLASREYEYFSCAIYYSCGACTNTGGICSWCTDTNTCIQTVQSSGCSPNLKIGQKDECPQLDITVLQYIPNNVEQEVELNANNLDKNSGGIYKCVVQGESFVAIEKNDSITCTVKVSIAEGKKKEEKSISVLFAKAGKEVALEDSHSAKVSVYRCNVLGEDCSHCVSVNATRYKCQWSNQQQCAHCGSNTCSSDECPAPTITTVNPYDGSYRGGTVVTITGDNLGTSVDDVTSVTLVGETCTLKIEDFTTTDDEDYMNEVPSSVVCEVEGDLQQSKWPQYLNNPGDVNITVSGQTSTKQNGFTFKVANISRIHPVDGPSIGGTLVTMYGINLGIGNKNVIVVYNTDPTRFIDCKVFSFPGQDSTIQCKTKALIQDMTQILLSMNRLDRIVSDVSLSFQVLDNPEIGGISPHRVILSGGTTISVTGDNLQNAHTKKMVLEYAGETSVSYCTSITQKSMECKVPSAPEQLRKDTNTINNTKQDTNTINDRKKRRKRSDCNGCTEVQLDLVLDGVIHSFTLQYFLDPEFDLLNENGDVVIFKSGTEKLILKGSHLNLVVEEKDIIITIGLEKCFIVKLVESELQCIPPRERPLSGIPNSKNAEVNVTVGNLRKTLGFLEYTQDIVESVENIAIIAGASAAALVFLLTMCVIFWARRYKKMNSKTKQLTNKLETLEMKIDKVAQQDVNREAERESERSVYDYISPSDEYLTPSDGYLDLTPSDGYLTPGDARISRDEQLQHTRSMEGYGDGYEISRPPYEHLRPNEESNSGYERLS